MTTIKLFTLTLLATTLTLSAAIPRETPKSSIQKTNSLSRVIANILRKRGIEDESSTKIAREFIGENEELLTLMLQNYLQKTEVTPQVLYTELSNLALKKETLDFSSYSFLVKITQKLSVSPLTKKEFTNLHTIATNNQLLNKVFT